MSEAPDKESRTEEATAKRLVDAAAKGNVPYSREVAGLGSLLGFLVVLTLAAGWCTQATAIALSSFLGAAGDVRLEDRESATNALHALLIPLINALAPVLLLIAIGGLAASLLQNGPNSALTRLKPKLERISPAANWPRVFGGPAFAEFARTLVKLTALGAITYHSIGGQVAALVRSLRADPTELPVLLLGAAKSVLLPLCIFAALLAAVDLAWSRSRWRRGLRMTREEVKEEIKESEGNPFARAKLAAIAKRRSSRRMLDQVPRATMVVVNPTHYAVAMRYVVREVSAPVVVAKGVDHMAARIRERAEAHGIPLIEDKPLARSLYDNVEVDAQIPPEFYRAVAEIVHYLASRRPRPALSAKG
jgi:flagellar biosynthetic protein FlhB